MRKTNALLAGVALVCSVAGSAVAQRGGGMGRMRGAGVGGGDGMGPAGGRGMDDGGRLARFVSRELFRGINLTDAEKAQLLKVRDDAQEQAKALATSSRTAREALAAAREEGDTMALKAARQTLEGERNKAIALRGTVIKRARAVLTSDQQKLFDDNRKQLRERAVRLADRVRQDRRAVRRGAMMRMQQFRQGRGNFGPGGGRGMRMGPGQGGFGGGNGPGMPMMPNRGGRGPGGPNGPGVPPPDSTGAD